MGFSVNSYAKIWKVENKGSYSVCEISISKKDKQTGKYVDDFSSKFVRFVGNAHLQRPMDGQRIKITNCDTANVYYKDGQKEYLKNPIYTVFGYELQGDAGGEKQTAPTLVDLDDDSDIPF